MDDRALLRRYVLGLPLLSLLPACTKQTYYEATEGRAPRSLLLKALRAFEQEQSRLKLAIDAGHGNGIETIAMLRHGLEVHAHDVSESATERLLQRVPAHLRSQLHAETAPFELAHWPAGADLVFAGYSLPFASPAKFHAAWKLMTESLRDGGRFAGQLFGSEDTWAEGPEAIGGTFMSREQTLALLEQRFEVEYFSEEREDGETALGEEKFWHVFHIIAKKRG